MPTDCGMNIAANSKQRTAEFLTSLRDELDATAVVCICNDLDHDGKIYFDDQLPVIDGLKTILMAGMHPHHAAKFRSDHQRVIRTHADKITFVGEIGLDWNRLYSPRKEQIDAFRAQLAIAAELNKPVYLHCREAWADFWPILREFAPQLPGGILHVFSEDATAKAEYLSLGANWLMSITKRFPHHLTVDEIRQHCLLETDAPYFGDDVWATAKKVAWYCGENAATVMEWSDANLSRFLTS